MIRFAKPTAVVLGAALGLLIAGPVAAQQGAAADQTAPAVKKKTAKAPAAKAPAAKAAADKGKPAEKTAAKPLLVASFGDWGVYQTQAAKGRVCYTLAQPKDREPADLKRDPAYAFISDRPSEGVRNEISFIMGFDVANPPAEEAAAEDAKKKGAAKPATVLVGDHSFELLAKSANLWVKNAAMESQLVGDMRKSAKLQVKATSKRGHTTTDTYSLAGFAQALERVQKECPSN